MSKQLNVSLALIAGLSFAGSIVRATVQTTGGSTLEQTTQDDENALIFTIPEVGTHTVTVVAFNPETNSAVSESFTQEWVTEEENEELEIVVESSDAVEEVAEESTDEIEVD